MLRAIKDSLYRTLDKDSSWWGLRRFKPAPDRPFTSRLLLVVCLAYGLPLAALAWAVGYAAGSFIHWLNPLSDDTAWLPRAAACVVFVFNALANGVSCWLWNRRAVRLDPTAFRHGSSARR